MNIQAFTETQIILEGDSVTEVTETVYVENVVLFAPQEVEVVYEATRILPAITWTPDLGIVESWLC